jgi:hypothetical protein
VTERTLPADLSPIWRLLAPAGRTGLTPAEPVVRVLPAGEDKWRQALRDGVGEAKAGASSLIVVLEGRFSRAVLSLMARRQLSLEKTPRARVVRDELAQMGAAIRGTYVLWPSARAPRIAFPDGRRRVVTWAQRSGVLGGGGNRLWARVAARSPLFTPFAAAMRPGLAFVVAVEPDA